MYYLSKRFVSIPLTHSDSLRQRILVLEYPDYLIFENGGSFIPESVESVIKMDSPA